jgi:sorting nexin-1/2
MFRVSTRTNIRRFKTKQFSSLRRFSDFLGLHDLLVEKYLRSGIIIPPAPQKNLIGATKVKMGSQQPVESGNGVNLEWIENRRCALERYLTRTAQHPILCQDPYFINFLESDEVTGVKINRFVKFTGIYFRNYLEL